MSKMTRPDDQFIDLIKRSGSADKNEAVAAQRELAVALETPLRKGVLVGDVLDGIFEKIQMEPGSAAEFPLDLLAPGTEGDHVAYTNPGHGRIPERAVEGDYVMVPTYSVASSIDYLLRYAKEARWDVVGRAMQVLEAGFTKKMNDDGWHTLLAARVDRNVLVYDADASAGQFTKRIVSLMKTVMRRNAGGNRSLGPSSDKELVIGLDLSASDSFIMPIKQDIQIFEDEALHRHQRAGFYGWAEIGFAVLDNRRILLGSF